ASPGEILTSANGASWTRQATLGHDLTNVVTDGATVRAVGQVGAMLTSTDAGATWAAEPNPAQDFGRDVAYLADAGRYVVLDNTGYLHSSPDFVTWTTANVGLYQGRSLACSDARCVAVGITGAVITSSDGVTWQTRRLGTTAPVYNGVAWSGSAFMVVGEAGANATSSDGLTWTINAAATSGTLYAVTYGGGSWVAVGASGVVVTSPTGTTWSSRASNTTQHLYAVAASGTACLAVGLNGAVTRGSANGQSWSAQTAPTTAILYGVAWDGTRWVVGGSRGTLLASTDGAAWSAFSPALDLDAVYGVRVVNGLLAAAGTPGSAAAAVLAP
ncbi:MAG: hypothetical protein KC635_01475, partial [Myxococcales bacterium]|nr:hypothetical protein [Myxococcales bacterium]